MDIEEEPDLRYFRKYDVCRMCGKESNGTLYAVRNESYGAHCTKCAKKRLEAAAKVRAALAKASP